MSSAQTILIAVPSPNPPSRPDASVVLCTWNRLRLLRPAIEALLVQNFSPLRFELLVVDNGSFDDTPNTLRALASANSGLRVLTEPRLGVAHARETGWRAAQSDVIAFIDDDCLAPTDWLRTLVASLSSRDPNVACVGGRVRALWTAPRPRWLSDALLSYLGVQDLGPAARPIGPAEWLCSNNLVFRREALERAGGFRGDLGRRGRRLMDGAETDLEQRLMASGRTCWYDPAAVVDHRIDAARLSMGWFLRRAFWSGASARWTAGRRLPPTVRRGGLTSAFDAFRRTDPAAMACTAARAAGHLFAACRANPYAAERT